MAAMIGVPPEQQKDQGAPVVLPPGRVDRLARPDRGPFPEGPPDGSGGPLRGQTRPDTGWHTESAGSGYRKLPEILSPEELRSILAQAYQQRGTYGLIVRTLFETGLRVSELVNLKLADVDFTERTMRVREGKGGKDHLVLFT